MQLRKMKSSDIDSCISLISLAMDEDEGRFAARSFEQHFKGLNHGIDDGRRLFVYEAENQVRAIVGLHHYNWGPEENVWLSWFAVHPDYQRSGLGTELFLKIQSVAKELGFQKLLIETYSSETFLKARRFYERQGFERNGEIKDYMGDGVDMVVYSRVL